MLAHAHYRPRILIALIVFAGLNIIGILFSQAIGQSLAPLLTSLIELFSTHYHPLSLQVVPTQHEWQFALQAETRAWRTLGQHNLPPGLPISSATLVQHCLQPLIVLGSVCMLLPWRQRRWHSALGLLGAGALIVALDVPLVLLGAMEDVVLAQVVPGQERTSVQVMWMQFMNGGGRLFLPLLAVALIAWLQLADTSPPSSKRHAT